MGNKTVINRRKLLHQHMSIISHIQTSCFIDLSVKVFLPVFAEQQRRIPRDTLHLGRKLFVFFIYLKKKL